MRQNVYGMACEGRIYNPKGEKTNRVYDLTFLKQASPYCFHLWFRKNPDRAQYLCYCHIVVSDDFHRYLVLLPQFTNRDVTIVSQMKVKIPYEII